MMTCHSGEDVIAFGMPSAKRTSPLSASPEPLLHMISRWIYGGEECAAFDNFPDDLTPRWHEEARSHVDATSRAKLWLARMKRGYTSDRRRCDPRYYRNEKALTKVSI